MDMIRLNQRFFLPEENKIIGHLNRPWIYVLYASHLKKVRISPFSFSYIKWCEDRVYLSQATGGSDAGIPEIFQKVIRFLRSPGGPGYFVPAPGVNLTGRGSRQRFSRFFLPVEDRQGRPAVSYF
jgi:hypothetical protein